MAKKQKLLKPLENFTLDVLWEPVTQGMVFANEDRVASNLMLLDHSDNDTIWRYMDLSKFLFLLEANKLHFTRLDKFEDKFEGEYPLDDFLNQAHSILGRYANTLLSVSKTEFNSALDIANKLSFYANCWHMSKTESYGMWKTYLKSPEGISIKTNIGKLKKSILKKDESVSFGKVEYIDYHRDSIISIFKQNREKGIYTPPIPGLYKRKAFDYEKEFRVIVTRVASITDEKNLINELEELRRSAKENVQISIDVNTLIEEIYVSPFCGSWYLELVKNIIKRYNLKIPVIQSNINTKPDYK